MNNITKITRLDIIDLFKKGYTDSDYIGNTYNIFYPYHGRLSEIEFLKKLYPLKAMLSSDSRFNNAEEDIWHHTINNDDWEYGWAFDDDRL